MIDVHKLYHSFSIHYLPAIPFFGISNEKTKSSRPKAFLLVVVVVSGVSSAPSSESDAMFNATAVPWGANTDADDKEENDDGTTTNARTCITIAATRQKSILVFEKKNCILVYFCYIFSVISYYVITVKLLQRYHICTHVSARRKFWLWFSCSLIKSPIIYNDTNFNSKNENKNSKGNNDNILHLTTNNDKHQLL